MGEIAKPTSRMSALSRRLAGTLMPGTMKQIEAMETQLFDMALKLEGSTRRLQQMTQDAGLFKDRWQNLSIGDYNPEKIGLDEYKKMLDYDAQVIAGFDLIQMGVLMKPWRIVHEDKKIVETLTRALLRMIRPSIRDAMKEMMKAIVFGYSVTEIVFGDFNGWWTPRQSNGLKIFDPETIQFFQDPYGNLLKTEQTMGGTKVVLPKDRTLVWSHDKEWGDWYGKSLLRGCYKNWFIKDTMLKFANIAYERFGSPILLGTASTVTDMLNVSEAIQHLYARSQAVILKRDDKDTTGVEVLESKKTEMPFDRYIRYHDEMILRRMLIGQRVFEGGGGTYGPKVPFDLLFMRFQDYQMELKDQMNELLQITTDLNWSVDTYPTFEFEPMTMEDKAQIVQKVFDALDRKVITPAEARAELGFEGPPPEEGATPEATPTTEEMAGFPIMPGRYLVEPHAEWLATGYKTMIVATRPYHIYSNRDLYIVSDDGVHGIMREGDPDGPYDAGIQKRFQDQHRISEREWEDWWEGEEEFWVWTPNVKRRFSPPLNFKMPRGAQIYIRTVKPTRRRS